MYIMLELYFLFRMFPLMINWLIYSHFPSWCTFGRRGHNSSKGPALGNSRTRFCEYCSRFTYQGKQVESIGGWWQRSWPSCAWYWKVHHSSVCSKFLLMSRTNSYDITYYLLCKLFGEFTKFAIELCLRSFIASCLEKDIRVH